MGEPESDKDRIRKLERELKAQNQKMEAMTGQFAAMLRENGLEKAVYVGIERFEKILAPLQSLAPTREFGTERDGIEALWRSLRRVNFETLETNFGLTFPGVGQTTEESAA
jgi:hypothetical protein